MKIEISVSSCSAGKNKGSDKSKDTFSKSVFETISMDAVIDTEDDKHSGETEEESDDEIREDLV